MTQFVCGDKEQARHVGTVQEKTEDGRRASTGEGVRRERSERTR